MTRPGWRLPAIFLATLLVTGCASVPEDGPSASVLPSLAARTPAPATTEPPFAPAAWPEAGSACDAEGYEGRLGRVEALNARTVRFTLCEPDAAFPARLADPALGVVDASTVALVGEDPEAARVAAGAGPFRIETWTDGDNVRLARVGGDGTSVSAPPTAGPPMSSAAPSASSAGPSPSPAGPPASPSLPPSGVPPEVVVLRWAGASPVRAAALQGAEVDGIDDPAPADVAELELQPELVVLPRPGLETAYLGFGADRSFGEAAVRRAFAQALDHEALARDAFPAGSQPATFTTPCSVPSGCVGQPWYEFNGPAAVDALNVAGFDRDGAVTLAVPDAPVPGLPDPGAAGRAVRDMLEQHVGLRVRLQERPAAELGAAIEGGDVEGLYLWGVSSILADPSGFLEPLFGRGARGTAAKRGRDVREALDTAAAAPDEAARRAAFASANDAIRTQAPIVPLVHPGSTAAYRADVADVVVSPLGLDPLGRMVPGDRRQLVVMGDAEPAGAWCAAAGIDPGSRRLCALVTPGLFAFTDGSLVPRPVLAQRCTAEAGFRSWTCRLRDDLAFHDGKGVDAGDVLASLQAQGDPDSPLRRGLPRDAFAAWDELFGGPVPVP
jgi:ABC-type transport system substrate-binding protein